MGRHADERIRGQMARPTYRGWRGDRLKELREARGCTQDQLAVLLNAQPTMVSKWERGAVIPVAENVALLAQVLQVSPQSFTNVPLTEGSLIDLRVWSGRSRPAAAAAAGMSPHRLLSVERAIAAPRPAEVARLAELYRVDVDAVQAAWQRSRASITAAFRGGA